MHHDVQLQTKGMWVWVPVQQVNTAALGSAPVISIVSTSAISHKKVILHKWHSFALTLLPATLRYAGKNFYSMDRPCWRYTKQRTTAKTVLHCLHDSESFGDISTIPCARLGASLAALLTMPLPCGQIPISRVLQGARPRQLHNQHSASSPRQPASSHKPAAAPHSALCLQVGAPATADTSRMPCTVCLPALAVGTLPGLPPVSCYRQHFAGSGCPGPVLPPAGNRHR